MKRVLLAAAAVAMLTGCPRNSAGPAREVPVEIDWPDAAPAKSAPATDASRTGRTAPE